MSSFTVTVETTAATKEQARALLEAAGFTVTRVAAKRAAKATQPPAVGVTPVGRADAHTDIPSGLSREERKAYVRGYAKGAHRYTRKHGVPSITGTRGGVVDRLELRRLTRAHEWDRHPTAHRAGMKELSAFQARTCEEVGPVRTELAS